MFTLVEKEEEEEEISYMETVKDLLNVVGLVLGIVAEALVIAVCVVLIMNGGTVSIAVNAL